MASHPGQPISVSDGSYDCSQNPDYGWDLIDREYHEHVPAQPLPLRRSYRDETDSRSAR